MRWLLLVPIGAIALACSDATGPNTSPTSIRLRSDAEDFVGSGHTYEYSLANAIVLVSARIDTFAIYIRGDEAWTGVFTIPSSRARLKPGFYAGATRFVFGNNPDQTQLSWFGEYGCVKLTGAFIIDGVSYTGTALTAIDLSFEQHCEGAPAALHGTVHWRADDPTRPPGPVNPVPAGLWRPAPGETPTGVNYVYMRSDSGDPIGASRTWLYTGANAALAVLSSAGAVSVSVGTTKPGEWWDGGFSPMNSVNTLQVGYYPDAGSVNPTKGSFGWSGSGRGCNRVQGWFAVDHLTLSADTVKALDVRFEQHCDGATPALHGAIHWVG